MVTWLSLSRDGATQELQSVSTKVNQRQCSSLHSQTNTVAIYSHSNKIVPPRQKGLRSLGGQKKHKTKNDPCRKLLPPGVNRFVEKGPLKPEKTKGPQKPRTKKVIKWKMILVENCYHLFFVFCFFSASEALYAKTYLLKVVTIFDKDHFSFNDFFLLRPFFIFCYFWASEALLGKIYLL